jgi:hypothetical protein
VTLNGGKLAIFCEDEIHDFSSRNSFTLAVLVATFGPLQNWSTPVPHTYAMYPSVSGGRKRSIQYTPQLFVSTQEGNTGYVHKVTKAERNHFFVVFFNDSLRADSDVEVLNVRVLRTGSAKDVEGNSNFVVLCHATWRQTVDPFGEAQTLESVLDLEMVCSNPRFAKKLLEHLQSHAKEAKAIPNLKKGLYKEKLSKQYGTATFYGQKEFKRYTGIPFMSGDSQYYFYECYKVNKECHEVVYGKAGTPRDALTGILLLKSNHDFYSITIDMAWLAANDAICHFDESKDALTLAGGGLSSLSHWKYY